MIPTSFDEANSVLGPPKGVDLDKCEVLSVWRGFDTDKKSIVLSCWKLTKVELEEFNRTGRIWLWIWGQTMPPASLSVTSPFTQPKPDETT